VLVAIVTIVLDAVVTALLVAEDVAAVAYLANIASNC